MRMTVKPEPAKLICLYDPQSPIAEAYRTLRTNIQYAGVNKEIKSLMVTSAGPEEGKTTTIANLAVAVAQTDKKVLLIDGDLRKPNIHRSFQVSNRVGLTNLLIRQAQLDYVIQKMPGIELYLLTSGPVPPNPAELLGSQRMKELLEELKAQYDMVLIDTPPLLAVTDAQLLASYVDGVLLVLGSGKVLRDHAKKAKALLDHVGANVVGAVLNKKQMDSESYYYYYYGEK